jgi:gluconolactonase
MTLPTGALDRFRQAVHGLDHPEGVAWGPDGCIYAGGEGGQIYRATPDGALDEICNTGGFMLGIALDGRGRIYACDYINRAVVRVNGSTVASYSTGPPDRPFQLPNFPAFAEDGTLYVTDSGERFAEEGSIVRIAPGGAAETWSTALTAFPNGCCLDATGTRLYVLETDTASLNAVPVLDDGSAGEPVLIAELPRTVPDGIACAADGSLYVSCYRPDAIYRVGLDGNVELVAQDPLGWIFSGPTNIAFGGTDLGQIVTTNLAQRHLTIGELGVRGLPLRYPDVD